MLYVNCEIARLRSTGTGKHCMRHGIEADQAIYRASAFHAQSRTPITTVSTTQYSISRTVRGMLADVPLSKKRLDELNSTERDIYDSFS